MALDIIFSFWFTFILFLPYFQFPVSTAEFIGEFWANKRSTTSDVAPIVLALYTVECIIGATSLPALKGLKAFAAPIGKARRIRGANKKFLRIFFYSLRFAY